MKLNQAFWPSVADALDTFGQPIGANTMSKPDLRTRFWMEAYLTALGEGIGAYAKQLADAAVRDLRAYSQQGEESQVPSKPSDDVVSCLRGAITAVTLLRNDCKQRGLTNLLHGLDDLIERSKKALGDC
jgi:hypothetical protein